MPVVTIESIAFGGMGVGRIGGKVVFVPFTAPGDEVEVEITSGKKNYAEARLVEILKPSQKRQSPVCPVYGRCGGCALQHLNYESQLECKQRAFADSLKRIGKIDFPDFEKPSPSPLQLNYRSKARFHIDGKKWGFREANSHRVVDIDSCALLLPELNSAFFEIKKLFNEDKIAPVSSVELVAGDDGKVVAVFTLSRKTDKSAWQAALENMETLKGFEVWQEADGHSNKLFEANDTMIDYSFNGSFFTAGAGTFSQANKALNPFLTQRVIDYAGLEGGERVLDLFCGSGNFTIPLSKSAGYCLGVESSKRSVEGAIENALKNGIGNAEFKSAQAAGWLHKNMKSLEKEPFDVVVLDPPRGGDPDAARALARIRPGKIVYVSCSPPTLARDLSILTAGGYRPFGAGLFDMFPQTYHIESVVGLKI